MKSEFFKSYYVLEDVIGKDFRTQTTLSIP